MLLHSGFRLSRRILVSCLSFVLLTTFLLVISRSPTPPYLSPRVASFSKPFSHENGPPTVTGSEYSRNVVLAAMGSDDTSWLKLLPDAANITSAVYIVNNNTAPLHTPMNKGREGMAYFSYMIDHYDNLSDVNIFMHSHRFAWHNSVALKGDSIEIVKRLNTARVMREGYQNLRCEWGPGCPDWIRPLAPPEDLDANDPNSKPEQSEMANSFQRLFPGKIIPQVLAQPCCAQFALSKDRIRSIPKEQLIYWRDWLVTTHLTDHLSGRIMEYLWQYFFTGEAIHCPTEHVCMCDTYGLCFPSNKQYRRIFSLRDDIKHASNELNKWMEEKTVYDIAVAMSNAGMQREKAMPTRPPVSRDIALRVKIDELERTLSEITENAFKLGEDPAVRDRLAGRRLHR